MGKGVIRDDSELSVAAARTLALQEADLILLIGQTLNWTYHFGDPPRVSPNATFIQIESNSEELHTDKHVIPLLGHIPSVVQQLVKALRDVSYKFSRDSPWFSALNTKKQANTKSLQAQLESNEVPLTYHRVLNEIKKILPEDVVIINEGANTLDLYPFFFFVYFD